MLGFALALGSLLTTGATAAWLAASSMVVGIYTAREQRKRAERAARRGIKDRMVMVREATADRPHVFGRVRLSGQVQFPGSSGQYNEIMHFALALGDRFDAIEEVWFGDQDIGPRNSAGWVTSPPFWRSRTESAFVNTPVSGAATITLPHTASVVASVWRIAEVDYALMTQNQSNDPPTHANEYFVAGDMKTIKFHTSRVGEFITINYQYADNRPFARAQTYLGAPGQSADPYLLAQLPGNWSETDRFTGTSYIAGAWIYDPDMYPTGIQDVSAVVRAELCHDPRTGQTAWTRNPALIARKYILKRFPNEVFDDASVIAAANVCDEQVAIGPFETQARYTFDDVIPSTTDEIEGLERILQAMVGSAVRSAGTWYMWAGAWEEPTIALDEDDLAPGGITIQGNAEDGVLFNGVSGRYMDPEKWVEDSFPTYVSPAYVAQDNGHVEILDIDLTQITDIYRVQRVRNLLLHKARQALTFACTLQLSAFDVTPGRMVTWTLARYGWDAKPFRCLKRVYSPTNNTIQCVFQEDAEEIYASDYSELTAPDPSPNTNLPDPRVVAAPALTFASGLQFATVLADGSVRPYLRVYWPQMDASVETIELWWRRAHEATWQQVKVPAENRSHDVYGISGAETYIVQGRAINGVGVRSAWSAYSIDVDPSAPANGGNVTLGAGANLLPNATMPNTASGWEAWLVDRTVSISDFTPTQHIINGRQFYAARIWPESATFGANQRVAPYNSIILYEADSPSHWGAAAILSRNTIPVSPGMRLEVQARAASINANAELYVQFLNAAGSTMSPSLLAQGGEHTLTAAEGKTGNLAIDNWKHLWGFVDVPAGAATARLLFSKRRVVSGATASRIILALPYLGYAHAGQVEPTPWSPGPSGGKIEGLNALDATDREDVAGPVTFQVASTPAFEQLVWREFRAEFDCMLEVTATVRSLSGMSQVNGGVESGVYGYILLVGTLQNSAPLVSYGGNFIIGTNRGIGGVQPIEMSGTASFSCYLQAGQTLHINFSAGASRTHASWAPANFSIEDAGFRFVAVRQG